MENVRKRRRASDASKSNPDDAQAGSLERREAGETMPKRFKNGTHPPVALSGRGQDDGSEGFQGHQFHGGQGVGGEAAQNDAIIPAAELRLATDALRPHPQHDAHLEHRDGPYGVASSTPNGASAHHNHQHGGYIPVGFEEDYNEPTSAGQNIQEQHEHQHESGSGMPEQDPSVGAEDQPDMAVITQIQRHLQATSRSHGTSSGIDGGGRSHQHLGPVAEEGHGHAIVVDATLVDQDASQNIPVNGDTRLIPSGNLRSSPINGDAGTLDTPNNKAKEGVLNNPPCKRCASGLASGQRCITAGGGKGRPRSACLPCHNAKKRCSLVVDDILSSQARQQQQQYHQHTDSSSYPLSSGFARDSSRQSLPPFGGPGSGSGGSPLPGNSGFVPFTPAPSGPGGPSPVPSSSSGPPSGPAGGFVLPSAEELNSSSRETLLEFCMQMHVRLARVESYLQQMGSLEERLQRVEGKAIPDPEALEQGREQGHIQVPQMHDQGQGQGQEEESRNPIR